MPQITNVTRQNQNQSNADDTQRNAISPTQSFLQKLGVQPSTNPIIQQVVNSSSSSSSGTTKQLGEIGSSVVQRNSGGGGGGSSNVVMTSSGGVSTAFPEQYTQVYQEPQPTQTSQGQSIFIPSVKNEPLPNMITSSSGQGLPSQWTIFGYKAGLGTSADRPIKDSEVTALGGFGSGGAYSYLGELYATPSGRGTSMGKTPQITVGEFSSGKVKENIFMQEGRAKSISNEINTNLQSMFNQDVETKKQSLISNDGLTPEWKQYVFAEYQKERSDFYTTKAQGEFDINLGSDLGLKELQGKQSDIIKTASNLGVNIGQNIYGGTSYTGTPSPKVFSFEGVEQYISKPLATTFLPALDLVGSERTITTKGMPSFTGSQNFPDNYVMGSQDIIAPLSTAGFGIIEAGAIVKRASKEAAFETFGTFMKSPTEDIGYKTLSKGYFNVDSYTLFNPNKVFKFELSEKGTKFLGTKLALTTELRLNPEFGKSAKLTGGGYIDKSFLPKLEGGFEPVSKEVFVGEIERNLVPVTDNAYLKDFISNVKSNKRYIIGGTFEKEGVSKELSFMFNPKTGSMKLSEFNIGGGGTDEFMKGVRNTFKRTKNTGKASVFQDGLGLYPEGDLYKHVGRYETLFKVDSKGTDFLKLQNIKGVSTKTGKTSGTFTFEEIAGLPNEFIPRATKAGKSSKYSKFEIEKITALEQPYVNLEKISFGKGNFNLVTVKQEGKSIFTGITTEKNYPVSFSKSIKSKEWSIPFTKMEAMPKIKGTSSKSYIDSFTADMGLKLEELPTMVGGKGKSTYSQFEYGFGKQKVLPEFTMEEYGYNQIRGPTFKDSLLGSKSKSFGGGFAIPLPTFKTQSEFKSKSFQNDFSTSMAKFMQPSMTNSKSKSNILSGTSFAQPQAQSFSTALKLDTSQITTTNFKTPSFDTGPSPFSQRLPSFDFGFSGFGGGFNIPNLDLGFGSSSNRKGKRKKGRIAPSLTAEVFDIVGKLPKGGRFGISPFQIRAISKKQKGIFDLGF